MGVWYIIFLSILVIIVICLTKSLLRDRRKCSRLNKKTKNMDTVNVRTHNDEIRETKTGEIKTGEINDKKEFLTQYFAPLDYDMSEGNPASWDNRIVTVKKNPLADKRLTDFVTVQGHPLPLDYELRRTKWTPEYQQYLVKHYNKVFRPECCPSTLSSDSGCMCVQPKTEYRNSEMEDNF